MQATKLRQILIGLVLVLSFIYIYPTLGWMFLSEEAREERLEQWREEDREFLRPGERRSLTQTVRRWAQFDRDWVINLGLDLQGGIHMVLGLDMDSVDDSVLQEMRDAGMTESQIHQHYQQMALRTIERRINEFEAREPVIQAYGDRQIQIQLPGERDIDRARRLIMRTAFLTFHIVSGRDDRDDIFRAIEDEFPGEFFPYLREAEPGQPLQISPEYIDHVREVVNEAEERGIIPDGHMIAFSGTPNPWDRIQRYQIYVLNEQPAMTGEHLTRAIARRDPQSMEGFYHIQFELDSVGARIFGSVTEENIQRDLAIVIDGIVESAPRIQSRISASGSITGSFSREEAQDLAIALSSGSMPARVREEFTGVVGATLGADSVRRGVTSAAFGLLLVVIFMLVYYRMAGVVANLSLLFNAILLLGAMAYFNATLTLPGIAGLILTIGMAVDANVLIYERIREEIRNGRSILASIDNGFTRARVTILDANITTLIAAAVLMQFGTGPIEGFAVTLSMGVCTSVFSALIVSRALFDLLAKWKLLGNLSMASIVKPDIAVNFLGKRRVAFTASIVLIGIGLAMFGVRSTGQGMFGVDFTTGTNMVVNLRGEEPIPVGEVRDRLLDVGFSEAIVQAYDQQDLESQNRFLIRISDIEDLPAPVPENEEAVDPFTEEDLTVSGRVQSALAALGTLPPDLPPDASPVEMERVETVGPTVGAQLKRDALLAIFYALIFIVAYITFRFEWKFAVGAMIALIHDVLVTVGIFAIFGRQISLPVVAALLTIIGYSLNDTIVVFDRIREDLRLYRGRGMTYLQVLDLSINQTLSRTLLTSLTTLLVVLILYIFGGGVINDFAFALLTGILVGTYSSIFVASPALYYLQKLQRTQVHATEESERPGSRRRKKRKGRGQEEEAPA